MITQNTYNTMVEDFEQAVKNGTFNSEEDFTEFKMWYVGWFGVSEQFATNFVIRMREIHNV